MARLTVKLGCALVLLLPFLPAQESAPLPSPRSVLGFEPGADGMLADYGQILDYFGRLDAASDRVELRVVGRTTDDRPMAVALISSPENLRRIEAIRADNLRLADPRRISESEAESIVARGKVIVLVNESIHSSEVGPAQASMTTAWHLASTRDPAWLKVLDDTVVLLNPCHNPDGYDAVVGWWNRFKDDPDRRGAPMPFLYHRYVGHDNNRDWFLFSQAESRVTVQEMHLKWRPQIVVDQHQMGTGGARMFIPPYQEPWEPNVHPLIRRQLEDLGRSVIKAMTADGLKGVVCNRQFDAWSPSRAYMHYHGGVRVLTEVASCQGADPIDVPARGAGGRRAREGRREDADAAAESGAAAASPDDPAPWPGGRWTLADIVTYSRQATLLSIKHASDHRADWLANFWTIHRDACAATSEPRAYLVPADQPRLAALRKLVDVLQLGGLEIESTAEPFIVEGRTVPAGSILVRSGQPYFPFARALFERTPYPEIRTRPGGPIRRPYDVTAHNLPLLFNLEVLALSRGALPKGGAFDADAKPLHTGGQVFGDVLVDPRDEGAVADALAALARGATVERLAKPAGALPAGALLVRSKGGITMTRARAYAPPNGAKGQRVRLPRIGIYVSWMANMDEGWTRFWFDGFGIPFTPVHDADIRAGKLESRFDVLVFASLSRNGILEGQQNAKLPEEYRGGIGDAGAAAVKAFVEAGGTLVAFGDAASFGIEQFALPIQLVPERRRTLFNAEEGGGRGEEAASEPRPARLDVPGTILWAEADADDPVSFGVKSPLPVFFRSAGAFAPVPADPAKPPDAGTPSPSVRYPVRFAKDPLVACGFAEGADVLKGQGAVAAAKVGRGNVILFSFSPQFRYQTWGTFPLLMNALLAGVTEPAAGE